MNLHRQAHIHLSTLQGKTRELRLSDTGCALSKPSNSHTSPCTDWRNFYILILHSTGIHTHQRRELDSAHDYKYNKIGTPQHCTRTLHHQRVSSTHASLGHPTRGTLAYAYARSESISTAGLFMLCLTVPRSSWQYMHCV